MQQPFSPIGFRSQSLSYFPGITVSLFLHVICAVCTLTAMRLSASMDLRPPEIFSVTLEGGEKLGGLSQAPTEEPGKKKPLPNVHDLEEGKDDEESHSKQAQEQKLTEPSIVEDPERILAEKKAKEEKQKALEAKLKAEEKKKSEEAAKKKAEEEEKKREAKEKEAEDARKKAADDDKKARDKKLQEAIKKAGRGSSSAAALYKGESANAGGEGFGAAALGGKGMGGGTLASVEFIAYKNELEKRVKAAWRWLPSPQVLKAQALVTILPDGVVQDVRIVASSGNSNFDESVTRAIYKASPLPPAPATLYDKFREVSFTFDSRES